MIDDNQKITIVGVDKDRIAMGADNQCWVVPFQLSASPDEVWQRRFYEVQQRGTNPLKRKARVNEQILKTEVTGADDLQKILDFLKTEVLETNVLCEADYQKKLKIREDLERLQSQRRDATQQFKEDADKLVF